MTETQVAAPSAQPTTMTIAQAAEVYAQSKVTGQPNPVSDAARTMGKRAAEARQERQAEAKPKEQQEEAPDTAEAPDAETTQEIAPEGEETEGQDDLETETIDLGEDVKLTKQEIRDNLFRRADYSKKTAELADARKANESKWSEKLTQLDSIVSNLEQKVGKPKSLKELITEHGPIDAMEKYAEQEEEMGRLEAARGIARRQRQEHWSTQIKDRDRQLAESYNKEWSDESKRGAAYTKLTEFALKRGASPEHLRQLTEPWMIEVLDLALQQVETKAGAMKITKAVLAKPQVVKPGTRLSAQGAARSQVQQATAKLKSSGSIADAAALLGLRRNAGRG